MTVKQETLEVLSNRLIAPDHFVLEIASPRIARDARPGQFVQILVDCRYEPLLPRPFSFLDVSKRGFRILYQVVGKGTAILSQKKKGDRLAVLGPLGNGFERPAAKNRQVFIAGGGVGIPPLYHFARDGGVAPKGIRVFLGARTKTLLHCQKEFKALGVGVEVATNDGSEGRKGYITPLLDEALGAYRTGSGVTIYACGPTPMLKAVSAVAAKHGAECRVSVEEPMPCGFGACLGCAIKVNAHRTCATEGSAKSAVRIHPEAPRPSGAEGSIPYRYAMACCEGPVFDAKEILWQ